MQPPTEFLTPEECAEVDKALLTSHDKFATRVAIYALRSLKHIAQQNEVSISALQLEQIEDWVYQDDSLQQGVDQEFRKFFSQLVISSLKPLKQASQEMGVAIEELTISQVIAWFEQEAKFKLEQK
ncbi:MAG: hypothetical protein HC866_23845 [Leptolyngbyaceae cyanobacterium RU_5_1]|nr:hypothetical protein [Leptolyngbyaceae cyanobacterium RU_5_1]